MKKYQLLCQITSLILSVFVTSFAIFAWFTSLAQNNTSGILGSVDGNNGIQITKFQVFNHGYQSDSNGLKNPYSPLELSINDLLPGDSFYVSITFMVVKENINDVLIDLKDIKAEAFKDLNNNPYENNNTFYNMADCFKIKLDSVWYNSSYENSYEKQDLNQLVTNQNLLESDLETKRMLNSKILSNDFVLINRVNLLTFKQITPNLEITTTFKFTFDLEYIDFISSINSDIFMDKTIYFDSIIIYS